MNQNSLDELGPEFTREAWYGLVFRWYALDREGNIGFFDAGYLPIPKIVVNDEGDYRSMHEFFANLCSATDAQIAPVLQRLRTGSGTFVETDGWHADASKGAFVFDEIEHIGKRYARGYLRCATPRIRLAFKELPPPIRETLSRIRFPITFSRVDELDVTQYFNC